MTIASQKRYKHYKKPRINALSLAQYCVASSPKERSDILQAARYVSIAPIHQLGDARRTAVAFLTDYTRPHSTIDAVKVALTRKIEAPFVTDFTRETAERNLEALKLFENQIQALGLGRFNFSKPEANQPRLILGNVPVSVSLDMLVHVADSKDGLKQCGGAIVQFAKKGPAADDAKRENTRQKRRDKRMELNRFVCVLIHQHLHQNFPERGVPSRDHCIVIDPRAGEVLKIHGRLETQLQSLEFACQEIENQWDSIRVPKDFED